MAEPIDSDAHRTAIVCIQTRMPSGQGMPGQPVGSIRNVLAVLFILTIPHAAATTDWDADPWLELIIGPERIAEGDEIGCHGIPGTVLEENPEAWVQACRDYVESRTPASRWSDSIVSFGAHPSTDVQNQLGDYGVAVIGDITVTSNTSMSDIWSIGFRGGTLEKNVGDREKVEQAAAEGGIVHMYWQALIEDVNVRRDRDLVDWLETSDAWHTTWGEAWSYSMLRNRTMNLTITEQHVILESPALTDRDDQRLWSVPTTVAITTGVSEVVSARFNDQDVEAWADQKRVLESGWRSNGQEVFVTLQPGDTVRLTMNGPVAPDEVSTRIPEWFDDKPWALTIAGLHVNDLRDWSAGFSDSALRFTWLVEPQVEEERGPLLPILAAIIAVTTVIVAAIVLRKDRQQAAMAFDAWNEGE